MWPFRCLFGGSPGGFGGILSRLKAKNGHFKAVSPHFEGGSEEKSKPRAPPATGTAVFSGLKTRGRGNPRAPPVPPSARPQLSTHLYPRPQNGGRAARAAPFIPGHAPSSPLKPRPHFMATPTPPPSPAHCALKPRPSSPASHSPFQPSVPPAHPPHAASQPLAPRPQKTPFSPQKEENNALTATLTAPARRPFRPVRPSSAAERPWGATRLRGDVTLPTPTPAHARSQPTSAPRAWRSFNSLCACALPPATYDKMAAPRLRPLWEAGR